MLPVAPVDVGSLVRRTYTLHDFDLIRFPAEQLLDVVAGDSNDALGEQQYPDCGAHTTPAFDALEGGFLTGGEDLEFSMQRRVFTTVNGRVILQDTNTSAVDFVRARRTPGTLPPGP